MSAVTVGGRVMPLPAAAVRRAVGTVLRGERRAAEVSVTFLGPRAMRQLNARYKRQDRVTDVLSFALTIPDGRLAGDIYICRAEAVRQARLHGRPGREELLRLVVHGVLHVLGYDHPDTDARERSAMWRRQERYVRKLLKK